MDGEEDIDSDLELRQTQYQRSHSSGLDRATYSNDGIGSPMESTKSCTSMYPWVEVNDRDLSEKIYEE